MGRVTLKFRNGQTLSETGYALGSPLNPLSRDDIGPAVRAFAKELLG